MEALSLKAGPFSTLRVSVDDLALLRQCHDLIAACGKDLSTRFGLTHWDPPYPFSVLVEHAQLYEVYAVFAAPCASAASAGGVAAQPAIAAAAGPVATFTVSNINWTSYFHDGLWPAGPSNPFYLGKLAVSPDLQKSGVGRFSMSEVERIGVERGCDCVRFDAVKVHPFLGRFYEACGYRETGLVTIKSVRGLDLELICYQKALAR